jgi:hypothetical protein
MKLSRIGGIGLVLALLAARAGSADVVVRNGQEFSSRVEAAGTTLNLVNAAPFHFAVVFHLYVAALYLPEGIPTAQVLEDVPKRLEIAYARPVSRDLFVSAAERSLARILSADELARLRPRIDGMHRLFMDVKAGDRYALTYRPGEGTVLALNGRALGSVAGADFARAYFGIWLDEKTLKPGLRAALLRAP